MIFLWLLIYYNNLKLVESFGINSFIQNKTILPCQYKNPPFIYPEHGHVLTGDLQIVCNYELRKLKTT